MAGGINVNPSSVFQFKSQPVLVTEEGGTLTNLANVAGTWGKFIPTSWGSVRLAGYQVWSGPFTRLIDRISVDVANNNQSLSSWNMPISNGGGLPFGVYNHTNISERIAVDVAFSFGYNGSDNPRRITKIRFDQNIVYDIANGPDAETDYAFNVRYGNEDFPEPIMVARASDPEAVVYYPGQIVITFASLTNGQASWTGSNASPIPGTIDVEIQAGSSVGSAEGVRTDYPDSDFAVPFQGLLLNDWKSDFIYVYGPKFPGNGEIKKYRLSTLELVKTVPVTVTPDNPSQNNDRFNKVVMSYGFGLLVCQFTTPGNFGAIYLIDPDTGQQVYKYGQDGWSNFEPYGNGYSYQDYIVLSEDTAEAITLTGTNQGEPTINLLRISKGANGFTATKSAYSRGGLPSFSDAVGRGENGTAVYKWGSKIYKITAQGMTLFYEDARLAESVRDIAVVGDKVFAAMRTNFILIGSDGQLIYDKAANDEPDAPFPAAGWSNTNETNRQLNLRKPGSVNYLGAWGATHSFNINMLTGEMTFTKIVGDLNVNAPGGGTFYDPSSGKFFQLGQGGEGRGYLQLAYTAFGERIPLRDFLRSLYVNTGRFTASQIEFQDIDDTIIGALLVKAYPLDTIVQNTCLLYQIEKLETRDKIRFYRNRPIVGDADIAYDLDIDSLALVSDSEDSRAALVTSISDSQKSVAEIKLTFLDVDAEYNENSVVWRRPDAPADATSVLNIQTIIVMNKTEALQLVQLRYQDNLASTTQHRLRLPLAYSDISKGDILRIRHGGYTDIMKATETTVNADHSVSILADSVSLERRMVAAIPDASNVSVGAALGAGPTIVAPFDVDALHPTHVLTGGFPYYFLAYGTDPAWAGGYVTRSNAKEPEGRLFEVSAGVAFAVYKAVNVLKDRPWEVDSDNLQLEFICGNWKPANNTTPAELSKNKKKNVCLYGAPGRWEIMQVASIVGNVASGIFRGLRGSEEYCGKHIAGDLVFVIDTFLIGESRPNSDIGLTDNLKAVSYWQKYASIAAQPIPVLGNALKPWAPAPINGERVGSDIVISWSRRDRAAINCFESLPMSETSEAYEIDIVVDGDVVRTIVADDETTATYTEAQQVADGTESLTNLSVAVYQISSIVGRGHAGKATLNVG